MFVSSELLATGTELLPVLIVLLGGSLVPPPHRGKHASCERTLLEFTPRFHTAHTG